MPHAHYGIHAGDADLSLLKNLFGFGIGRPTIATGSSLSGKLSLGHVPDRAIMNGLWRPHIEAAQLYGTGKSRR